MSKNPPPSAPRTLEIIAEQNQGLPGQFLAAYSPKTQKIYIAGTFNAAPPPRFLRGHYRPR